MNKTSIILIALICGTVWTACKKNTNTSVTLAVTIYPSGIYGKINGVTDSFLNSSVISTAGPGSNYVEITGNDSSGRTIDLRINNFTKTGTFSIPQPNDSAYYSNDFGALNAPVAATSGSITIEAVNDSTIDGTFSYTAGSIVITSGTFNVKYQ